MKFTLLLTAELYTALTSKLHSKSLGLMRRSALLNFMTIRFVVSLELTEIYLV